MFCHMCVFKWIQTISNPKWPSIVSKTMSATFLCERTKQAVEDRCNVCEKWKKVEQTLHQPCCSCHWEPRWTWDAASFQPQQWSGPWCPWWSCVYNAWWATRWVCSSRSPWVQRLRQSPEVSVQALRSGPQSAGGVCGESSLPCVPASVVHSLHQRRWTHAGSAALPSASPPPGQRLPLLPHPVYRPSSAGPRGASLLPSFSSRTSGRSLAPCALYVPFPPVRFPSLRGVSKNKKQKEKSINKKAREREKSFWCHNDVKCETWKNLGWKKHEACVAAHAYQEDDHDYFFEYVTNTNAYLVFVNDYTSPGCWSDDKVIKIKSPSCWFANANNFLLRYFALSWQLSSICIDNMLNNIILFMVPISFRLLQREILHQDTNVNG